MVGYGESIGAFLCPSQTASVCSVVKNCWRGAGGLYHRTHRTACRPTQNTQKVLGREWLGFQCIQCAVADGFSVFCGSKSEE